MRKVNKTQEEILKAEYESLKAIVGEEKAIKYFDPDDVSNHKGYSFKGIAWLNIEYTLKRLLKEKPIRFVLLMLLVVAFLIFHLNDRYFYWW